MKVMQRDARASENRLRDSIAKARNELGREPTSGSLARRGVEDH
jgi:hypothetical protein